MKFLLLTVFVAGIATGPVVNQQPGETPFNLRIPDFLQNASPEARQEFMTIASNMDRPRREIETDLSNWAQRNGVKDSYDSFVRDLEAKKTELRSAIQDMLQKLPQVYQNLQRIEDNKDLTGKQTLEQSKAAFDGLGEKVKNALAGLVGIFIPNKPAVTLPGGGSPFPGNNNGGNGGNGGFPSIPIGPIAPGGGGFGGNNNGNNGGPIGGGSPWNPTQGGNQNNGGATGGSGFPGTNNGGFVPGFNNNNNNGNNGGFNGGNQIIPGNNGGFQGGNNNGGFPNQGNNNQNQGFQGNGFRQ